MKKKVLAAILSTVAALSFAGNAFAANLSPYQEFLRFRSRGATQGGTSAIYTFYDLNNDGIKEAIVKDVFNEGETYFVNIFVAGKHYSENYNDNVFRIPDQFDGIFLTDSNGKLYILYRDPANYRMDYLKISRMDYDGDTLSLVPIYEGYDVINTRVHSYGLNDANLNWKDIHDLQSLSESDILSFTEGWKYDGRWWYQNSDGSYPKNSWKAIYGAWYYFDGNGYMLTNQWIDGEYFVGSDGVMLTNTNTPDGYQVDASGKWIR